MTTNQTIDGVSRDLIEKAMQACFEAGHGITHDELRALLDAPTITRSAAVTANVAAYTPGMGLVELRVTGGIPSWLELGEEVTVMLVDPAAQPQGEPVAPFYISMEDWNTLVRDDVAIALIRTSRRKGKIFTEPLYAEQPAPVAVDVLITGFHTTESGGGKYAINIGFRSMADMQAADAQLRELLKSR